MKRNAFGQLMLPPHIRMFNDNGAASGAGGANSGEGGDGDNGGENGSQGGDAGGSGFKAPGSQEEFDRIIAQRVARAERSAREDERRKIAGGDEGDKSKSDDEGKSASVSGNDVDKRIADALAAKDKEFALERIADRLDKELEGRSVPASKLFALDRSQFVKDDGKTVDTDALAKWVGDNASDVAPQSRRLRGQGERDSNASGGSVQSGRDRYNESRNKSRKD